MSIYIASLVAFLLGSALSSYRVAVKYKRRINHINALHEFEMKLNSSQYYGLGYTTGSADVRKAILKKTNNHC